MSFIWPYQYSTPILGVFPLHQTAPVGVSENLAVELFSKYSNLCENHTDGQTCNIITVLCVATSGNKRFISVSAHIPYIFRNYNHRPTFCSRQYRSIFVEIFLVGTGIFLYFGERGVSPVQGSSKVTEYNHIGANRKRICDFLLVHNSNLGPILHHFGDQTAFMCYWPQPYSTLILGCSSCTRSPMLGVNERMCLKLFGREIIFVRILNYLITVPKRHRWTDRQMDDMQPHSSGCHAIAETTARCALYNDCTKPNPTRLLLTLYLSIT